MRWCVLAALLAAAQSVAADRYAEIRQLINSNRHLSAHLTMAIDGRTIAAVRKHVSGKDIPVLVGMLADKDDGVASAASGLLASLGNEARPALEKAAQGRDLAVAGHARDALQLMDACYKEPRTMNPDVCPKDKP